MIVFTEWLREKGIFEKFKENTLKSPWGMFDILRTVDPVDFTNVAFDWEDPLEDNGYWSRLDGEWWELAKEVPKDQVAFGSWEPKIRLINPKDLK